MNASDPLFLAGAAFFSVIVVGSLLVALNDWLEARHAAHGSPNGSRLPPSAARAFRRLALPRRWARRRLLGSGLECRGHRCSEGSRLDRRALVVDWR
jgi:hypothetical protein